MDKKDLLDEQFLACKFSFSVFLKYKVKIKEIFEKHNKEIGWKFSEKNDRDENGDKLISLELKTSNESLSSLNEKMDFLVGLIEDVYKSNNIQMDEETLAKYNTGFIGIASGEELEKLEDINIKSLSKKNYYYYRQMFDNHLLVIGDINKIIEAEKNYPKIIIKIFGKLVQKLYEENIEKLKKVFIDKKDFEMAKAIVEKLEKSNVNKIPYNLKKFRFSA